MLYGVCPFNAKSIASLVREIDKKWFALSFINPCIIEDKVAPLKDAYKKSKITNMLRWTIWISWYFVTLTK